MRIGIDLGGTKIAAGLVDETSGMVECFSRQPTPRQKGSPAIIKSIVEMAQELHGYAKAQHKQVHAVGICVPELVDNDGTICSAWNFPLPDLADHISRALEGINITIDSDVRAAARAEARFGSGRARESFIYISLGTGMSYSLCINGHPWRGKHGFAIHFASSPLALPFKGDGGLLRSNAEDFASGKGIETCYKRITGLELKNGVHTLEQMSDNGDVLATRLLDEAGEVTGRLIAQIVNMLDPEMIVLGGGLGTTQGRYRTSLEYFMRKSIWAQCCRSIELLPAKLGVQAGVIGAATDSFAQTIHLPNKNLLSVDHP